MGELRLIRHNPSFFSYYEDQSKSVPLIIPHNENFMIDTILEFPLSKNALADYIQQKFVNTTIVHVSIYETVSQHAW